MKKSIKFAALLLSCAMIGSTVSTLGAFGASGNNVKVKYGDINNDGEVKTNDLTRLMKYLAGEDVEAYSTDMNFDGEVTAKDLTRLMKYIAGDPSVTAPVDTEVIYETENPEGENYPPLEEKPASEDISDKFDLTKGLTLVNAKRKTEFKIVCSGTANQSTTGVTVADYALATHEYEVALALQDTILDMTGCRIPIVNSDTDTTTTDDAYEILIGSTSRDSYFPDVDFTAFKGDSFAIKTNGNRILLAAALNPRSADDPYQDYDIADGIWNALDYFVQTYLHYDPSTTLVVPTASNGINLDIVDYEYTDPYVAPELKENETIDGFALGAYGDVGYEDLMLHNAYVRKGIDSPCYSKLTAANINNLLKKANDKGYLIYNTTANACTCDQCLAAAEEEGTEMGAYFKVVKQIAEQLDEGKTLRILAANETYIAPKTALGDNVEVLIYNAKLCSAHAVNDTACATNAAFVANVEAWKNVVGYVSVLDFTSDYYYFPISFPNIYTMKKNVEWYKAQNFYAVYLQFDVRQSILEFTDLRQYLARVLLENPNMSDEEYSEFINSGLAYFYGEENSALIRRYIDRFDEEAHADSKCFDIYTEPTDINGIKHVASDGTVSYDLEFAKEAYNIWEQVHPYNETLARNDSYVARMLSSRYQSESESYAKTQYQEWLMAIVEMRDKAWVLNRIMNQDVAITG